MAEQFITKIHKVYVLDENGNRTKNEKGKFITKPVETTYRIDADFIPSAIDEITQEFIENYCVAKKKTEWLVAEASKKETRKFTKPTKLHGVSYKAGDTCEQPISFVTMRSDFATKFFPEIIVGDKPKEHEETFNEKMLRLYGKK